MLRVTDTASMVISVVLGVEVVPLVGFGSGDENETANVAVVRAIVDEAQIRGPPEV